MKYLSTLILLGSLMVSCSAQRPAPASKNKVQTNNPDIADVAPEQRKITEVPPTEPAPSLPVMTVDSPPILLTPIPGNIPESSTEQSAQDWQTFTSSTLGVSISYPPDWSVSEEADEVIFTAPNGAQVQLNADSATPKNSEFKIGNRYCTSRTNEHGQIADICLDNVAFRYTATFSLPKPDGSTQWVTLITQTRTVGDVFEGMFNSLQPTN